MKKKNTSFLIMLFCAAALSANAQSWSITGNSGTNSNNNFIGTKDNHALVFKTNNAERMRISSSGKIGIGIATPKQELDVIGNINIAKGFALYMQNHPVLRIDSSKRNTFLGNGTGSNTSGSSNTAIGYQALYLNTTGYDNVASGYLSLYANKTGSGNVANGTYALSANTSGSFNVANGKYALSSNTTGTGNIASGLYALAGNTSGSNNIAHGSYSLDHNTTGGNNIASGTSSLFTNTTGYDNVAIGTDAMYYNTTGYWNTAAGSFALEYNTTGAWNTALGTQALLLNTTGSSNAAFGVAAMYANTSGAYNTAAGNNTLTNNTTGSFNTVHGEEAMVRNTTGSFNTAVGVSAMYNNTASNYNCAVGYLAMAYAIPGWNNTAVGSFAGAATDFDDMYNTVAIGMSSIVTASNQARIGNSSTTSIGGYANWSNISDGRVKKNIKQNVPGLAFIKKLQPVTYNLDLDAADKLTHNGIKKDKEGKSITVSQAEINARNAKQKIVYTGFVAQDVEKAAKELNYDFSGVDAAKNEKDLYGLRYAEFVVPLVKAVQELSNENEKIKSENDELKKRLEKIEALMNIKQTGVASFQSAKVVTVNNASLQQNIPNPFNRTTKINYTLPQQYSSAKIIITDKAGKTINQINISGNGKSSLNADASILTSGTYQYSLIIDGRIIETKQMAVIK